MLNEILNDPKYGKEFQKILDEFLEGKVKVKEIKKIVKKYCKEKGIRTIGL